MSALVDEAQVLAFAVLRALAREVTGADVEGTEPGALVAVPIRLTG